MTNYGSESGEARQPAKMPPLAWAMMPPDHANMGFGKSGTCEHHIAVLEQSVTGFILTGMARITLACSSTLD
jgi:hypothetical protein